MSKSKKPLLRWVDSVGALVTSELTQKFGRPFQFHQSGPYTQSKYPMVEIYLNEASFRSVPRESPTDKYDDRFGFVIRNDFQRDPGRWELFAGFRLGNKVIARHAFVPNLAGKQSHVAGRLWMWIHAAKNDGLSLSFDQAGGGKYVFALDHTFGDLNEALSKYADLERKSSGIHSDETAGWAGADFAALQSMRQFNGMNDDASLFGSAKRIAHSSIIAFDGLRFLYDLLRPQMMPEPEILAFPPNAGSNNLVDLNDERQWVPANVVQRQGQPRFRAALLRAYKGRCAISGCDVEQTLQAAHIVPYSGPRANHCSNGLLLRADLHNLFDLNLLKIDPETLAVSLAPELRDSCYDHLEGMTLRVPDSPSERPNHQALKKRFEECS